VAIQPAHSFHGLEIAVRSISGARALRIVHPAGQMIPAHRHDWPLLTFPALGGYAEEGDDGFVCVAGPAVVLHPAGRCHANCIHALGMETFSIEFDPDWLATNSRASIDRSFYWLGGRVALASRPLTRLWCDRGASDEALRQETTKFLHLALSAQSQHLRPDWFATVQERLSRPEASGADQLAQDIGLHPRWLAHAYRQLAGEGLHQTVVRQRAERAISLLRGGSEPIAEIAVESGFCDQSHLNRALRRLIGRTPNEVRAERAQLAALMAS
jgi:AraC family transcriptional regulator